MKMICLNISHLKSAGGGLSELRISSSLILISLYGNMINNNTSCSLLQNENKTNRFCFHQKNRETADLTVWSYWHQWGGEGTDRWIQPARDDKPTKKQQHFPLTSWRWRSEPDESERRTRSERNSTNRIDCSSESSSNVKALQIWGTDISRDSVSLIHLSGSSGVNRTKLTETRSV